VRWRSGTGCWVCSRMKKNSAATFYGKASINSDRRDYVFHDAHEFPRSFVTPPPELLPLGL
jgi:hypothetical protein